MDFQTYHRHIINGSANAFLSVSDASQIVSLCSPKTGDSLLHVACRCGELDIVRILVEHHKADAEVSNYEGKRLLHEAAQCSQADCVKFLLHSCGVQVDPLKRADWTPLMLAATKDSIEVINILLQAGANPLLKNKDGWNVFHIACREGHLPILKLLLRHTPSVWDTRSHNERSPLHTAALNGRTEVIAWLLQSCPYDINALDSCGSTPLMDALRAGHVDAAAVLVFDHQAKWDVQDKVGRQAMHQVSQAGQLEALDFLVNSVQASVNVASDLTGETPLHTAAKEGQHKIIEKLLDYGAAINQADRKGRTALHIASGSQHAECVQVMLQRGAQMLPDKNGTKARDLARKTKVKELLNTLM